MRIRLEGLSGTTDFVVTDVSDTQLTLNGAPASGAHTGKIDRLSGALIRDDGKSWLDAGFLEGQLFKVTGGAFGDDLYKINTITGATAGKTDVHADHRSPGRCCPAPHRTSR